MPLDASIRRADPGDAPAIASVIISSRLAFLPYARSPHTNSAVRTWVQQQLVPSGGVVVAVLGSEVVGMLASSACDGRFWIDQLYVAPGHVNQGIGSALLLHALATLGRPVQLFTFAANEGSRRFYERHGFQLIAQSDGQTNEEQCPDVLYELG